MQFTDNNSYLTQLSHCLSIIDDLIIKIMIFFLSGDFNFFKEALEE